MAKNDVSIFWAIFSQTHLVTLGTSDNYFINLPKLATNISATNGHLIMGKFNIKLLLKVLFIFTYLSKLWNFPNRQFVYF
jgi:hypothetical protein